MAVMALVIEDHPDARLALKTLLEEIGYGVWEAGDGESGIASATQNLPDVIILDLMLPDMAGVDVLRRLKSEERSKAIPVVVVSAISRSDVMREAVQAGASDYIVKPWSDNELETVLEWVLTRAGKDAPIRTTRGLGLTPNDFWQRDHPDGRRSQADEPY